MVSGTPRIRSRSPVAGLERARLSFVQVLGQSVSAVAPSAVMVTLPALVIPDAGRATIAVFVAAAILMTAVGYCIGQFATRMVAVSGLYSYIVKGLGAVPGFGGGWSLLIGYAAAAMASTLGAASYLAALLGRVGIPQGSTLIAVLAAIVGLLALLLMIRGVKLSARIMLAIEVFAIVAASTALVVAFVQSVREGATPSAGSAKSGSAVGFAVLLAITSFVGFESAGTVAREARNPFVAVPRAIRWTPIALGALYVFAAAMQLPEPVRQGVDSLPIVLTLPDTSGAGSSALSIVMELGITASWFACILGSTTALSRTLFAMGREGVVPSVFGRTHNRFHTPHVALAVAMPVVVVVPVLYLFFSGSSRDVLIGLLAVSAHGYVFAYVLLCIATPTFLRRIGELTRLPLIVGVLTATAMVALVGWAALSRTYVAGAATAVYVVLLLLGATVFAIRARRSPGLDERMGVYDEAVADDLLGRYRPWEVRR
jgi:amino acid transporter